MKVINRMTVDGEEYSFFEVLESEEKAKKRGLQEIKCYVDFRNNLYLVKMNQKSNMFLGEDDIDLSF